MTPTLEAKYHAPTHAPTDLVRDQATRGAIVRDQVCGYDSLRSETDTPSTEGQNQALSGDRTSAPYLRERLNLRRSSVRRAP